MKKISSFILAVIMGITMTFAAFPSGVVNAAGDPTCEHIFLGLRPWYMGLTEKKDDSTGKKVCVINTPSGDAGGLSTFIWTIALNIIADVTLLIGYVALIFVIYGGFKYIMSNGEPGKVAQAKTILTNALIGLVIGVLATVIVNTILVVFGNAAS